MWKLYVVASVRGPAACNVSPTESQSTLLNSGVADVVCHRRNSLRPDTGSGLLSGTAIADESAAAGRRITVERQT